MGIGIVGTFAGSAWAGQFSRKPMTVLEDEKSTVPLELLDLAEFNDEIPPESALKAEEAKKVIAALENLRIPFRGADRDGKEISAEALKHRRDTLLEEVMKFKTSVSALPLVRKNVEKFIEAITPLVHTYPFVYAALAMGQFKADMFAIIKDGRPPIKSKKERQTAEEKTTASSRLQSQIRTARELTGLQRGIYGWKLNGSPRPESTKQAVSSETPPEVTVHLPQKTGKKGPLPQPPPKSMDEVQRSELDRTLALIQLGLGGSAGSTSEGSGLIVNQLRGLIRKVEQRNMHNMYSAPIPGSSQLPDSNILLDEIGQIRNYWDKHPSDTRGQLLFQQVDKVLSEILDVKNGSQHQLLAKVKKMLPPLSLPIVYRQPSTRIMPQSTQIMPHHR